MIPVHQSDEYFDFTTSYFGTPEISESTIQMPVYEFGVAKGYPGYTQDAYYDYCILVYEDVVRSIRTIYEYTTPERTDFKAKKIITDGPFVQVDKQVYLFGVTGVFVDLNAYVDWEIVAVSVRIEEVNQNE